MLKNEVKLWVDLQDFYMGFNNRWLCCSATIRTTLVSVTSSNRKAEEMVRSLGSSYSFWSLFSFHSDSCLHWSAMFCALVSHLSLSELLPNTRCSFPLASILFSKRTAEGRMKEHKEDS